MKTTKTQGILFGLGMLGATVLGAIQPAQAAPQTPVANVQRSLFPNLPNCTYQVLTGRVTRNYPGNGFLLITDRGSTYRVTVIGGEPRRLSVGDRVQVAGEYRRGSFRAERFKMIRNR